MFGLPRFSGFWFWIGFLLGLLVGLMVRFLRDLLASLRERVLAWREQRQQRAHIGFLPAWRARLRAYLQTQHLAAPLFPLHAVLVPPRVLPLPPMPPLEEDEDEDPRRSPLLTETLPPGSEHAAWEALFAWPALTLSDALRGGASLVLMGPLGSGKSTALVHVALQRMDADPQALPLFIHVADLPWDLLPQPPEDTPLWTPLAQALKPPLEIRHPREERALQRFLENVLAQEGTLILIDGVDEIPPWKRDPLWDWIRLMQQAYPSLQWVVAVGVDGYGPLVQMGFQPVRMMPWDATWVRSFLRRWHRAWNEYVAPHHEEARLANRDAHVLIHWLTHEHRLTTPLELTLKAWGLWAGDLQGSSLVALVHALGQRLETDREVPWDRLARAWLQGEPFPEDLVQALPAALARPAVGWGARVRHAVLLAYAAGMDPDEAPWQSWFENGTPPWELRTMALAFWGRVRQETLHSILAHWLKEARPPLYREVWESAKALAWSGLEPRHQALLRALHWLLQHQQVPVSVRLEATWHLWNLLGSASRALFRQLLRHRQAEVRQAALLGCALTQDAQGLRPLMEALDQSESWPGPLRRSAFLALASLSQQDAARALGRVLVNTQSDPVRREVAEALARDPHWGRQALLEAAQDEDLLVRKAAAYALAHVPARWARERLETLAREDPEWLVRNAAEQMLQALKQPSPWVPRPLPPLHREPWLEAFAHARGLTLAPGRAAWLLLEQVLQQGEPELQRRALRRLLFHPNAHWVPALKAFLEKPFPLGDEAWHTLQHFAWSGLPVDGSKSPAAS